MLKKLVNCIKGYWLYTILSPICVLAEVALSVLIPYKMADLIDYGVEVGNMDYILSVGKELLVYAALAMVTGVLSGLFASIAGTGFATNVRKEMYYNVMDFSFSNVDKFSTAGLVTRMTTDVTRLQFFFQLATRMAFRVPGNVIFAMIMSFRVNKKLPWIFLLTVPILAVGLVIIMKHAMPSFKKMFAKFDDLNRTIQENVRGIRVVKSFVKEKEESDKFLGVSGEVRDLSVHAEKVVAWNMPLMNFCVYLCTLLIAWFGAKLIVVKEMTTGQLMSIMSYIIMILTSLMFFSLLFVMGTQAVESSNRVAEVLNEEPSIKNCENPEKEVKDGSIKFENVAFGYNAGKNNIQGINLDIESGETVGIIGGTGSGKSSLVMLIPRLYDVTDGAVYVGGTDVRNIELKALRKSVAMVLQKNILFSGSIKENLMWGNPNATDEEMWNALKLAEADTFVNHLEGGLDYHIEQGGSNVSGGQRQRLCIARALMANPKILILDDSTSAVDTATEAKIKASFNELLPDTTKIIIAQRISSVKDADKIVVLENGEVNGVGTHDELLKSNEIYREVYESQTKGGDFDEPTAE